MLDSSVRHVLTEWRPVTSMPVVAGALAVMAVIALWALWRHRARSTQWERLALLILAAGSVSVVRNAVFFGLFALIVVPLWIGHADAENRSPIDRPLARAHGALVCLALVAAGIAAAVTVIEPASTIEFATSEPES